MAGVADRTKFGKSGRNRIVETDATDQRTRTKRVQFQVNFKSGMIPDGKEEVFLSVPDLIAAEAAAELPADER